MTNFYWSELDDKFLHIHRWTHLWRPYEGGSHGTEDKRSWQSTFLTHQTSNRTKSRLILFLSAHRWCSAEILRTFFSLYRFYTWLYLYLLLGGHDVLKRQNVSWQRTKKIFWDVALCSLVLIDRRFRGDNCLHHQGGSDTRRSDITESTSERSVNFLPTWRNIPEGSVFILGAMITKHTRKYKS